MYVVEPQEREPRRCIRLDRAARPAHPEIARGCGDRRAPGGEPVEVLLAHRWLPSVRSRRRGRGVEQRDGALPDSGTRTHSGSASARQLLLIGTCQLVGGGLGAPRKSIGCRPAPTEGREHKLGLRGEAARAGDRIRRESIVFHALACRGARADGERLSARRAGVARNSLHASTSLRRAHPGREGSRIPRRVQCGGR